MLRKTKIVCTLGPASDSVAMMSGLLRAGMNIARFNFSHGTHAEHRVRIETLREAVRLTGLPVALMLDTKGPEIRTGVIAGGGTITLERGDKIVLTTDVIEGNKQMLSVSYQNLPYEVFVGGHIFVADGLIDLEVTDIRDNRIHCLVRNGGTVGSRKNVNVPGVKTSLPPITEKDEADIRFGIEMGMDYIAASFIRKGSDLQMIQALLDGAQNTMRIIAKIEDEEGLGNIKEIARLSSGVMVARGDLGVQLDTEQIPLAQKRIIRECNQLNRPVITATQMLDSMIVNPKPTRAELTDVANAIFDGTDAVMLSGETANGKYPIESVEMLDRIARAIESSPEYAERNKEYFGMFGNSTEISEAVTKAAYLVATDTKATAIVTPTLRGNSARMLSKYRPTAPIIAVTASEVAFRHLLLNWGVYPILSELADDSELMIQNALRLALKHGYVQRNQRVVTAAGIPFSARITMNTIKVHFLGNILNRGMSGFGTVLSGSVVKATTPEEAQQRLKRDGREILVVPVLTRGYESVLGHVRAVVSEKATALSLDRLRERFPELVFIGEVPGVVAQLENNQSVSLDGAEKIIYEGFLET